MMPSVQSVLLSLLYTTLVVAAPPKEANVPGYRRGLCKKSRGQVDGQWDGKWMCMVNESGKEGKAQWVKENNKEPSTASVIFNIKCDPNGRAACERGTNQPCGWTRRTLEEWNPELRVAQCHPDDIAEATKKAVELVEAEKELNKDTLRGKRAAWKRKSREKEKQAKRQKLEASDDKADDEADDEADDDEEDDKANDKANVSAPGPSRQTPPHDKDAALTLGADPLYYMPNDGSSEAKKHTMESLDQAI